MLITYPIAHHWLTGFVFIVEKNADISNFEFYSHECTLCVTSVCWEICGLNGLYLMRGTKINWHLINPCRKFGHGLAINSWHPAARENVKVYEIECCNLMEYSCNHCGALKFSSASVLSNHQRNIAYFSSQRNLEHTCKWVKNTNPQAFEPAQGLQQENLQQSTFSFPSLVMVGLMLPLSF